MNPPHDPTRSTQWHPALSTLFDAGLEHTIHTLIHHAHHARADRIAIRLDTEGDLTTLDWQNNGYGYETPEEFALHALAAWPFSMTYLPANSRTSWTIEPQSRYAASTYRRNGQHVSWAHEITPHDLPFPDPIASQGLHVRFATRVPLALITTIAETAIRNTRLHVTVNGNILSTSDHPLGYAGETSQPWRNADIAVVRLTIAPSSTFDLVIEGLTIDANLPRVHEQDGPTWITRVNATRCPELSIDLAGATDAATRSRFLQALRNEATKRLYQAIAAHSANHAVQIDHAHHENAHKKGIHIPLHPLILRRWTIEGTTKRETVARENAYLMRDNTLEPHHRAALQHTLERADPPVHLYQPDARLEGHPEYDTLPSVTAVHTEIDDAGNVIDRAILEDTPRTHVERSVIDTGLCDRIIVHLVTDDPDQPYLTLDTDVTLCADTPTELDDLDIVRTRTSDTIPEELTILLYNATYDPWASKDSQNNTLFIKCRRRALTLLDDEHRAHATTIAQLVETQILEWVPTNLDAHIDIVNRKIAVSVTPRRNDPDK